MKIFGENFIYSIEMKTRILFLSYLVRFLSNVAEYSNENKMTASNLGICIGCSLLFPKDQLNNSSMSNSYASASIILELMIIHHKQLFPSSNSSTEIKSIKSQPDLIPTEFHSVIFIFIYSTNQSSFFNRKVEVVPMKIC